MKDPPPPPLRSWAVPLERAPDPPPPQPRARTGVSSDLPDGLVQVPLVVKSWTSRAELMPRVARAVAASPSIELVAGASYESPAHYCPTGALSVIHGTTNAKITIREA